MGVTEAINLASVVIIALLILFMTFEPAYLKKLLLLAAFLFVAPLLAALLGNTMGWFDVYTIEIVALRQGALSVLITCSYGVTIGVALNAIKIYLTNSFRKTPGDEAASDED